MDARVPERYLVDRRVMRLAPVHFRSFILATLWSVSNRTEGRVGHEDIDFIPGFAVTSPPVLVGAELWKEEPDHWFLVEFPATQTSKAQLEAAEQKRRSDRERQARHRNKSVQFEQTADSDRDVTRDNERDVTVEDKGKASARQGEAKYLGSDGINTDSENRSTGEVDIEWPTAPIPGAGEQSGEVADSRKNSPRLLTVFESKAVS
jgi:hypothetical protein